MAEQYISIRVIHDRITKHPLMQTVTLDDIITYTVDFMRIIGVPSIFENKITTQETDNYKIKLPCDYVELIQMRGRNGMYHYSTNTFHLLPKETKFDKSYKCVEHCLPIVETRVHCEQCSTCKYVQTCEFYHFDYNKTECISLLKSVSPNQKINNTSNTFVVQGGYMFLSNKCDTVDISYRAIKTDSEGLPMIPDNSNFTRALIAFIKKEYFTILFDLGSVTPQSLQQAQQDYAWAVGSCETDMNRLDLSKAEAFFNSAKSIIEKRHQFETGFNTQGDKLVFKKQ